jgi:hypothetical protein
MTLCGAHAVLNISVLFLLDKGFYLLSTHNRRFIISSLDLLKAGGVAVHTMEFTLSSLDKTLETGSTVLWRKKDIEQLVRDLKILGYKVYPIHWGAGNGPMDRTPDVAPYSDHLKLALSGHFVTSFAIVIQKPEGDDTQFGGLYAKPTS